MKKIFIAFFCVWSLTCFSQSQESVSVTRIAILNFDILCAEQDYVTYKYLSTGFAESLTDAFSRLAQFRTVERIQLEKILWEQKLRGSNKLDTVNAIRIGKLFGAERILLGSCQIANGYMLVNMRIANSETSLTYPLDGLPIIVPLDSSLHVQTRLCASVLKQFNHIINKSDFNEIKTVTSNSTKSAKAYEFLSKGVMYYENRQFEEAISMFDLALQYDKKYGKAYYRRGLTNYALSQYEKAADDFGNISNYLKKDTIYQLMGNAYYMYGDYKKSLEYYKKAESINPNKQSIKVALLKLDTLNRNKKSTKIDSSEVKEIFEFNDGIAKVKIGKKYGFIDLNNQIVIPVIFDGIKEFKYGLAPAKQGSKWGYINSKGVWVISPRFHRAEIFEQNKLAEVSMGIVNIFEGVGVIDTTGKIIVPTEFFSVSIYNNAILVNKMSGPANTGDKSRYGLYGFNGEIILPVIYERIRGFYKDKEVGYVHVCYKGKWGVVNFKNEIIVPFKYKDEYCISDFSNGYFGVKENEKWGFVDNRGLEIIDPVYERVMNYTGNGFPVKQRGKWGVIDSKSNPIIPISYDNIEHIHKEYYAVKKGNLWGIVNIKNEIICNFLYEKMGSELSRVNTLVSDDEDVFSILVLKSGKEFWIDKRCKCVMDCK